MNKKLLVASIAAVVLVIGTITGLWIFGSHHPDPSVAGLGITPTPTIFKPITVTVTTGPVATIAPSVSSTPAKSTSTLQHAVILVNPTTNDQYRYTFTVPTTAKVTTAQSQTQVAIRFTQGSMTIGIASGGTVAKLASYTPISATMYRVVTQTSGKVLYSNEITKTGTCVYKTTTIQAPCGGIIRGANSSVAECLATDLSVCDNVVKSLTITSL